MYDEKINFFNEIKNSLTDNDIINFMQSLGILNYEDRQDAIIFPTICHNTDISQASMKLYYYKSNKLFHCYTDCGESFDIFGLIKRYCKTNNLDNNKKKEITHSIINKIKFIKGISFDDFSYTSLADKYKARKTPKLKIIPQSALLPFVHYYTTEWLNEGIEKNTMDKFNILFSITQNKIIIPHYDIDNNLVGIRARALNDEDIIKGKYKPVTIENKTYNHPLSLNLYGLNINKENIKKKHYAIVFEGEKSVLLMDKYYPLSTAVASCGSNFHKTQLDLLLKNDVTEIIIAYDKENINTTKRNEYFDKLWSICNKYKNYCNFSFIFDRNNLLNDKDSPIDKGKEVFEQLLKERVKI